MFDDIPSVTPPKGMTPTNLPVGEPEDMFSAVDTVISDEQMQPEQASNNETAAASATAVDMEDRSPLANTSAMSAGILRPKTAVTSVPKPQSYDDHLDTLVAPEMAKESAPHGSRMIFVLIVGALGVGLIGGIAYAIYAFVFSSRDTTVEPGVIGTSTTSSTSSPAVIDSGITADQVIDEESDREVLFGDPIDRDGDGIDDTIEQTIGTDVLKKDTDGDGLSDGDEILVWKTNPLNADTDGDTYPDGLEVSSGYSPLGPGKLFATSITDMGASTISSTVPTTSAQ